ncbi:sigma-54 dependent transcriptional regulator [Luteibacter sp. PPL201]|uniref:Sigma-54 dependent transcriptional regulator n=1 Tax=Luteibacter sahnii TaxID=3021977 RepID=A0ABT6BDG1_9GAMM|nr:sigma-54 dependent transcriptional regulator [Luteibacter sp. PPL193]MDY1549326.1 sigma-54 dependent transcriptional regulator [Luteibacter sp. PPL193]
MSFIQRMLVLDDDVSFSQATCGWLRAIGMEAQVAANCAQARQAVADGEFDAAMIDIGLPDGCGLDLLSEPGFASLRRTIIVSGDQALASSLDHVLPGARCLGKPFTPASLQAALMPARADAADDELLGHSPLMREARREIDDVARLPVSVLLVGESGTGKELAARRLHRASGRRGRFVAFNGAALSPELLASQLFGHLKGSFTGANERRIGLAEAADGGTLFIDELGDMPEPVQVALLRFLETRDVVPVGATRGRRVDVRVVSATHRPPRQAMREGRIRTDLYFRLAGYEIRMPALRERREDVPPIAERMLAQMNDSSGLLKAFGPGAFDAVARHAWPGNVRELRQHVQRAYVRSRGLVYLPPPLEDERHGAFVAPIRRMVEVEREAILAALDACGGDRAKAAHRLGISLRTIYNKLASYRTSGHVAGKTP